MIFSHADLLDSLNAFFTRKSVRDIYIPYQLVPSSTKKRYKGKQQKTEGKQLKETWHHKTRPIYPPPILRESADVRGTPAFFSRSSLNGRLIGSCLAVVECQPLDLQLFTHVGLYRI